MNTIMWITFFTSETFSVNQMEMVFIVQEPIKSNKMNELRWKYFWKALTKFILFFLFPWNWLISCLYGRPLKPLSYSVQHFQPESFQIFKVCLMSIKYRSIHPRNKHPFQRSCECPFSAERKNNDNSRNGHVSLSIDLFFSLFLLVSIFQSDFCFVLFGFINCKACNSNYGSENSILLRAFNCSNASHKLNHKSNKNN